MVSMENHTSLTYEELVAKIFETVQLDFYLHYSKANSDKVLYVGFNATINQANALGELLDSLDPTKFTIDEFVSDSWDFIGWDLAQVKERGWTREELLKILGGK